MTLHLLLAQAGEHHPSVTQPISEESVLQAPVPAPLPKPDWLFDDSAAPDSLQKQRWALVVPAGERGKRLLSILAPLRELRAEQQGAPVDVYEAPPGQDADAAHEFRARTVHPSSKPMREQARYLLLAGGPEVLSQELHEELAGDGSCYVGRLAFEKDEDYEAYVAKVVARERRPPEARRARAVVLCVRDGTSPTKTGHEYLVAPMARRLRDERKLGHFPASELVEAVLTDGSSQRLLELAQQPEPGLFFTLSHGVGAPGAGWSSAEEQRRRQGCMVLGRHEELTPDDVGRRVFMPGGIWFSFACFSAGTPTGSVYQPWMEHLIQQRAMAPQELESVQRSRPVDARPFVAALPQAALANPRGPLAVIGHVDLAWTFSFHDAFTGRSHVYRFEGALSSLVQGHRAGVALNMLARFARQADAALRRQYQAEEEARLASRPTAPASGDRAYLWMERHDLTRYVLLGDPAVRLVEPSEG